MYLKKATLLGLLAGLALLVLVACGGGSRSSSTQGGAAAARPARVEPKTISVAISETPATMDFHYFGNTGNGNIKAMIMEGLLGYDENPDRSVTHYPLLAESYESSPDGKVWTFKLRKGIKFHNGEDFNSDACMVTYQRIIDDPTLNTSAVWRTGLEKVEAPDDYTFIMYMNEPSVIMRTSLESTPIFAPKAWREHGTDYIFNLMLYGTGPWILTEYVDGQFARFKKNENYWGDFRSYYDEVIIRFVGEESTGVASMLAGDLRVYGRSGGLNRNSVSQFRGRDDIVMMEYETTTMLYFGMQCRQGHLFSDRRAREAFSLAIDRQAILNSILTGGIPNTTTWAVPGSNAYDPNLPLLEYNPEKAKQLLKETGYNGAPMMLTSSTQSTMASEVVLALAEMLNDVGFNFNTRILESAPFLEMRLSSNYDVFMVNGMPSVGGDCGDIFTQRLHNDLHASNFVSEQGNEMIRASNREFDVAKRLELMKEINRHYRDHFGPVINLVYFKLSNPYYKGVVGFRFTGSGGFDFTTISWEPDAPFYMGRKNPK